MLLLSKKCDCTIVPFTKECLKYCIESILRKATPEEKIKILGMDSELAYAIKNAYKSRKIRSFQDLEKILRNDQIEQILLIFTSIEQSQIDYFNLK